MWPRLCVAQRTMQRSTTEDGRQRNSGQMDETARLMRFFDQLPRSTCWKCNSTKHPRPGRSALRKEETATAAADNADRECGLGSKEWSVFVQTEESGRAARALKAPVRRSLTRGCSPGLFITADRK